MPSFYLGLVVGVIVTGIVVWFRHELKVAPLVDDVKAAETYVISEAQAAAAGAAKVL